MVGGVAEAVEPCGDTTRPGVGAAPPADGAASLPERVGAFVREHVMPYEDTLDAGGPAADAVLRSLRERARRAGLWALPLPAELGGQGLGLARYATFAEAEGASDHGPAALGSAPLLDVTMLRRHGTARVHEAYLTRLVSGELRTCYAMTEPDVPGTDPFLTGTRATLRPDGSWRLTGRKWFTSGAGGADLVTVLARTDGAPPDREGLSLFLVPTASPGFRVVRELPVLGGAASGRSSSTAYGCRATILSGRGAPRSPSPVSGSNSAVRCAVCAGSGRRSGPST
ncbi:acyl-CoA dehydrogenase [Streptomyces alboflavus]|uniref:Acyl-CoA dehydrogenase n=1 Tax=Streptomyces alboflavus TaxID=67267 RepID=A0A1Z1WL30_9ACTN|nr:acyl-CoA dehydrogenase [Streptomyces alboflavus]